MLDSRCPQPNAPYYLYEFPALVSYDGGPARRWYGWVYATGCARELGADGAQGATEANIRVDPGYAADEASFVAGVLAAGLRPLADVLSGGATPPGELGGNVVPALPAGELPDAIPAFEAARMTEQGFTLVTGPDGSQRVLLDASRVNQGGAAQATIDWWDVHGSGDFFDHDAAGLATDTALGGGVMRVELAPTNWSLRSPTVGGLDATGGVAVAAGDPVRVGVTVALGGISPRSAPVGWRWGTGSGAWTVVSTVRLSGGAAQPAAFDVPAPAQPDVLEVAINPFQDAPNFETTFADNQVEIPLRTQVPPQPGQAAGDLDLAVGLTAPPWLYAGESGEVAVSVREVGGGSPSVATLLRVGIAGQAVDVPVTATPDGWVSCVFQVTAGPVPGPIPVRAEVNPAHDPAETDYENNVAAAVIDVRAAPQADPFPTGAGVQVRLVR